MRSLFTNHAVILNNAISSCFETICDAGGGFGVIAIAIRQIITGVRMMTDCGVCVAESAVDLIVRRS